MAYRYYLMPVEVINNGRGPKYLKWIWNPGNLDVPWCMIDYGLINAGLVIADVDATQHASIAGNSDVCAAPENIDQNIGAGAVSTVQNCIEALKAPAGWVNTSYTYRQILRIIAGLFLFAQRHHALHDEPLVTSAPDLDLTWSHIPTAKQNRVLETAQSLGYGSQEPPGGWTVRQILKHLADLWGSRKVYIGLGQEL